MSRTKHKINATPPPSCLVKKEKKINNALDERSIHLFLSEKKYFIKKASPIISYTITVWLYQGQKLKNEKEMQYNRTDKSLIPG